MPPIDVPDLAFTTAVWPSAILELTSLQLDCEDRLTKINPPWRRQTMKRRPTLPICDTLSPFLRGLPNGPVVRYQGRALAGTKSMSDHLTSRAARCIRRDAAAFALTRRAAGRRDDALAVLKEGRRRSGDARSNRLHDRHTVAAEMRKRGVPVWEVAGFLGHTSGTRNLARTTSTGRSKPLMPTSGIWGSTQLPPRAAC
jgi:hypothetical protein